MNDEEIGRVLGECFQEGVDESMKRCQEDPAHERELETKLMMVDVMGAAALEVLDGGQKAAIYRARHERYIG